ncbi:MAG: hypothetical protein AAF387_18265 [Pseudomonadota bacterium]
MIDEYRASEASYTAGDALVVLGRRHEMDRDTETDFINCVGEKMVQGAPELSVIPEQEFVNALYPWFEASTAPMDISGLDRLLENQVVAQKLDALNLRYFIWINGFTETTDSSGSLSCAVGPGGGGCFGFKSWDDEANYEAAVWDLNQKNVAAKVNTETEGTSFVPAIIVPVPLLARVQAKACDAMSTQLLDTLGEAQN